MNLSLTDIVVTGYSSITAAGNGIEPVLALIGSDEDALVSVPEDVPGGAGLRWGKVTCFKASDFMPPLKARKFDRCSQFVIATAGMALKDAALDPKSISPDRIGVALGCGFAGIANSAEFLTGYFNSGAEGLTPMLFPNTVPNAPASNASIEYGLKGPNVTQVQRFCSAESAFMMACRFISEGRADVMLTGGVDELTPLVFSGFAATGQLRSHATNFGEGCGILVIESAAHAAKRGAVIKGRVESIRTVGCLLPGHEEEGIDLLFEGSAADALVSLSGTAHDGLYPSAPPLLDRTPGIPVIDAGRAVGRSFAMGGTAIAALIQSLGPNQQGLHLAASPKGPYFAIRFSGGTLV